MGGDEFVIVSKQSASSYKMAGELAAKLIDATAPLFNINGEELGLGVSIGSAYYPSDATSFKDVIHAADLAAAEVKRTGRGKLIAFDESYAEIQKKRFELSRSLGVAIIKKEIGIAFQPIINAKTGQVGSFEALARWHHDGKWVEPEEFINVAEQTDRIITLGYLIFEQACGQAGLWLQAGHNQKVAVNVSVKQLLADDFVKRLVEILRSVKLPAKQLKVEVTESLFADTHKDTIYSRVKQLKNLGIAIQIDDFGTGYSSLSRLHQFPISAIKIDKSFVMQIQNKGHTIIESALLIAKNFNLEVVAEGVETFEQASELHAMGVDYLQGYYFSKPSSELVFDDFDTSWQDKSNKALI